MKPSTQMLSLLGFFCAVACAEEEPGIQAPFVADTAGNGMVSVTNNGHGVWSKETRWTAEEDLRIGTVHGGGPAQFAVISDMAVDDEGRMFVAEVQAGEIRVFNFDGSFSHSFGRPGEGPGEFQILSGLTIAPNGLLWAQDARIHRISVFEAEGELVSVHPIKYRGYLAPWEPGFDSNGLLLDWETPLPTNLGGSAEVHEYPFVPLRVSRDFQEFERFPPVVDHPRVIKQLGIPKVNDGPLILHTGPLESLWFADMDEYRVFRRELSGDTTLVFSNPADPARMSAAERDSLLSSEIGGHRLSSDDLILEEPVLRKITTSIDGYFLAFPRLRGIPEGTVVDVFDLSGHFLGRVSLPSRLEMRPVPELRDGHLYGITKDEFDVPYVVRFLIKAGVD